MAEEIKGKMTLITPEDMGSGPRCSLAALASKRLKENYDVEDETGD